MEITQVKLSENTSTSIGTTEICPEEFLLALNKAILTDENIPELPGKTLGGEEDNYNELAEMIMGLLNTATLVNEQPITDEIGHGVGILQNVSDAKAESEIYSANLKEASEGIQNGPELKIISKGEDLETFKQIEEANKEINYGLKSAENSAKTKDNVNAYTNIKAGADTNVNATANTNADYNTHANTNINANANLNTGTNTSTKEEAIESFIDEAIAQDAKSKVDTGNLNIENSATIVKNPVIQTTDTKLPVENVQIVKDSIMELVETTTEGETSVLKVKLHPEELGTVDIALKMEKGKLSASILVENEQVKAMFNKSVNELKESLLKQNFQVEKINIDLNLGANQHGNFEESLQKGFNQGQNNMKHKQVQHYQKDLNGTPIGSMTQRDIDVYKTGDISILA